MLSAIASTSVAGRRAMPRLQSTQHSNPSAKLFDLSAKLNKGTMRLAFMGPLKQFSHDYGLLFTVSNFSGGLVDKGKGYTCYTTLGSTQHTGWNKVSIEQQVKLMTKTALAAAIDFALDYVVSVEVTPLHTDQVVPPTKYDDSFLISQYRVAFNFS
jgi:hypothetical protein